MAKLDVNGTSLEYVEKGSGEPIVFVHGSASDYRTWNLLLSDFSLRNRVISYSRRYHWPNEPIPEGADYSMEQHVGDLQALLFSLGATPAHLVGHSYGAFVALLLALRKPEIVRTLVLAEPPVVTLFVSNSPKPAEILSALFRAPRIAVSIVKFGVTGMSPAAKAARRGDMETAMRIFGHAVLGSEFYDRLSESRLEQVRANAIKAEFLGSGLLPLEESDLRGIETPTLLVGAERSPVLFSRLLDRLGRLIPNTIRVEIPESSHIMHEDNATAYGAAVQSFVTEHERT